MLYFLDLLGTFVFAVSGTLSAMDKKLDPFGASVIGLVTAIGGGTLRDLLLNFHPIGWINDINYLICILAGIAASYLFKSKVIKLKRTFHIFDTLGIAVFTLLGIQKTLTLELHPIFAILMGVISAVFGGVIRDTLCNDVPLIFRREVYALACTVGGVVFFVLTYFEMGIGLVNLLCILVIVTIRFVAIKYKWSLPSS